MVKETTPKNSQKRRKYLVVILYIKGLYEELRRVFGRYEVPTYFKPTNTLRQLLVRPNDPLEKVVGPVYRISCEDYEASYVGVNGQIWRAQKTQ